MKLIERKKTTDSLKNRTEAERRNKTFPAHSLDGRVRRKWEGGREGATGNLRQERKKGKKKQITLSIELFMMKEVYTLKLVASFCVRSLFRLFSPTHP